MSVPVGCKTEITSYVQRTGEPMNRRVTIEQDWLLHPTKGWKRSQRRKKIESVTWSKSWPRFSRVIRWKSWL